MFVVFFFLEREFEVLKKWNFLKIGKKWHHFVSLQNPFSDRLITYLDRRREQAGLSRHLWRVGKVVRGLIRGRRARPGVAAAAARCSSSAATAGSSSSSSASASSSSAAPLSSAARVATKAGASSSSSLGGDDDESRKRQRAPPREQRCEMMRHWRN